MNETIQQRAKETLLSLNQDEQSFAESLAIITAALTAQQAEDAQAHKAEVAAFEADYARVLTERDALARQVEELTKDKAMLDTVEAKCWDVRCENTMVGFDDCDVGWMVIEHHMADPKERQVGIMGDTPREAITSAMKGETHE